MCEYLTELRFVHGHIHLYNILCSIKMTAAWNHNTSPSYTQVPWQPASIDIWDKKYRLQDRDGLPIDHTIDDTLERVARALADIEPTEEKRNYWYGEFLWALKHGAIPAGRIISNAGTGDCKTGTSP